jgi:hypothetical protein
MQHQKPLYVQAVTNSHFCALLLYYFLLTNCAQTFPQATSFCIASETSCFHMLQPKSSSIVVAYVFELRLPMLPDILCKMESLQEGTTPSSGRP